MGRYRGKIDLTGCDSSVLSSRMMATGNCRFYSQSEHEFIGHGTSGSIAFDVHLPGSERFAPTLLRQLIRT